MLVTYTICVVFGEFLTSKGRLNWICLNGINYGKLKESRSIGRPRSAMSNRIDHGEDDLYAGGDRILFCHRYINYTTIRKWIEAGLNGTIRKLNRWQHGMDANRGVQGGPDTN
ncbi:hypothetical protein K492DRAFT_199792 [Lichtheimia hyalospora FSU 10163]|nr:hypothetical protein K492DRAFT_199792 [Lichtheimia hyalospora FSU 10163]